MISPILLRSILGTIILFFGLCSKVIAGGDEYPANTWFAIPVTMDGFENGVQSTSTHYDKVMDLIKCSERLQPANSYLIVCMKKGESNFSGYLFPDANKTAHECPEIEGPSFIRFIGAIHNSEEEIISLFDYFGVDGVDKNTRGKSISLKGCFRQIVRDIDSFNSNLKEERMEELYLLKLKVL